MKARSLSCLTGLVGFLAGCGINDSGHDAQAAHEEETLPSAELFEKGRGVRLPEEMARSLGVEIAEAAERPFRERLEVSARVYQAGRAIATLSPDAAARLSVGEAVTLRASDASPDVITGQLARLDSQTATLGQVEALFEFADASGRYPVGSSMISAFLGREQQTALAVPASAVLQGTESAFVYAVSGSHFVRTPVKVGMTNDGWVQVIDGLYAGDSVVAKACEAMWMIELCALKGGTPCCPVGKKPGSSKD